MAAFVRSGNPPLTVGGKEEYVNVPDRPPRRPEKTDPSGSRTVRLVVVSFGLLCVLQSVLNISLRFFVYNSAGSGCNNSLMDKDSLQTRYDNLVAERDSFVQQLDECSEGWRRFGNSLYYVASERRSWTEGLKDCRSRQADLVVVNSRDEQTFLKKLANGQRAWIGLGRTLGSKQWTWVDGTLLTEFSYWAAGQPDNAVVDSPDGELCVENFISIWNDLACHFNQTWICEKKNPLI